MILEPFALLALVHSLHVPVRVHAGAEPAVRVKVNGDVAFLLKLAAGEPGRPGAPARGGPPGPPGVPARVEKVTAGPTVECIYQYPEKEQINAIMSNMMNELTKVFVQANDLFAADDGRRRPETRFRVVSSKKTHYFDHIYSNMTAEYSNLYNNTASVALRSSRDPCQHQEEIKMIWRKLLDNSLSSFQKAALRCLQHLRMRRGDERAENRLGHFIMRQVAKVRSTQLDMLCERFQLCYNELL